jgi:hypothetical protein
VRELRRRDRIGSHDVLPADFTDDPYRSMRGKRCNDVVKRFPCPDPRGGDAAHTTGTRSMDSPEHLTTPRIERRDEMSVMRPGRVGERLHTADADDGDRAGGCERRRCRYPYPQSCVQTGSGTDGDSIDARHVASDCFGVETASERWSEKCTVPTRIIMMLSSAHLTVNEQRDR